MSRVWRTRNFVPHPKKSGVGSGLHHGVNDSKLPKVVGTYPVNRWPIPACWFGDLRPTKNRQIIIYGVLMGLRRSKKISLGPVFWGFLAAAMSNEGISQKTGKVAVGESIIRHINNWK